MPEIPEEDIKILKEYKQHLSVKYNNMLRGKIQLTDLSETVESILQLDKIFKKFPENPANINVYRVGNGVGKSRNDGDKVLYSQVISTSTSKDIGQFFNANILYQRELQKGEKAIPLDLVLPYFNVGKAAQSSECELLLQPCTYEVENLDSNVVKMKNAKEINVDELLEKRLEEIKNKLQNKDEYIQYLCEQAKSENKYDNSNVKQEKLQDLFTELEKNNKLEILKEKDKKIKSDNLQYDSDIHGKSHTRKVNFFALVLAQKMKLDEKDTEILLTAVQNHDIGRKNDYENKEHGAMSIDKAMKEAPDRFENFTSEEKETIKFIILEHSKSSKENEENLQTIMPDEKRQKYKLLLDCMKDADKLDRVRINDLNPSRLALKESQALVGAAYEANENLPNILEVLDDEILYNIETEINKVRQHQKLTFEKYETKQSKEVQKEEDISDIIMKKFISESKEKGILSKISQIPKMIKNRLQEKMKGKEYDVRE